MKYARQNNARRGYGRFNPARPEDKVLQMIDRVRKRQQTEFRHERLISIKLFKHRPVHHSRLSSLSLSLCSPLCVIFPHLNSLNYTRINKKHPTFPLLPPIDFLLQSPGLFPPPLTIETFNILLFLTLLLSCF